jgi:dephospho-CoA kinase
MLHIALTGNIGAGKTTVANLFRRWGATVIDADALVREAQAPGSPVLTAIAERFGADVLGSDGALDRAALRRRVMGDAAALAALNALVHPAVQRRRAQLASAAEARGDRIVVSDIPLLFEVADPTAFDAVVLVDAPVEIRRARLLRDRELTATEAERMIEAQQAAESKRARSDYVIENGADLAALEAGARRVWAALEARAAR